MAFLKSISLGAAVESIGCSRVDHTLNCGAPGNDVEVIV